MSRNLTKAFSSNGSYNWFQFYVEGVLLFIVGTIGLVGNSCSVVSFARQRIQRVFHRLLLILATFDAIYIVSSILLYALPMFIDNYTLNVKLYLLPYLLPIIHVALVGSIYSTVALAAERYITVCHPFMRFRPYYRGRLFILPVILFAILYTIPKCFELRLQETNAVSGLNGTHTVPKYKLVPTELRKNKMYVRIYLICMNFFVQILLPFVTLVILNFKTYQTIKDSERKLVKNFQVRYSQGRPKGDGIEVEVGGSDEMTQEEESGVTERARYCTNFRKPHKTCEDHQRHQGCFLAKTRTVMRSSSAIDRVGIERNVGVRRTSSCRLTRKGTVIVKQDLANYQKCENKATLLRKREVALARISIYIVFVFLFCHSVRIVPNTYEMVTTYTEGNQQRNLSFPDWVRQFTHVSHLLITFASSANFYIYFAKYGRRPKFVRRGSDKPRNHFHQSPSMTDRQNPIRRNRKISKKRGTLKHFMRNDNSTVVDNPQMSLESTNPGGFKIRDDPDAIIKACDYGIARDVIIHKTEESYGSSNDSMASHKHV